jgi:hypothetical protein
MPEIPKYYTERYRKILAETPPNGKKEGEVTYSYHDCSAEKTIH